MENEIRQHLFGPSTRTIKSEDQQTAPLSAGSEMPADERQVLVNALAKMLDLYVEQLESSAHGGWSQDEDEVVREVYTILKRYGFNAKQSHNRRFAEE